MINLTKVVVLGLMLCAGASVTNAVMEEPLRSKDWKITL